MVTGPIASLSDLPRTGEALACIAKAAGLVAAIAKSQPPSAERSDPKAGFGGMVTFRDLRLTYRPTDLSTQAESREAKWRVDPWVSFFKLRIGD